MREGTIADSKSMSIYQFGRGLLGADGFTVGV